MIHFHGTPCGATRPDVSRFLAGRHALIPWPRPEDLGAAAEVCQSFCIDNGAFSAWKSGEPITDWEPYYDFIAEWRLHPGFAWAVIPDVIDGDERAQDSLIAEWLDRCPFEGVPVWHLHESLERLQTLCRTFDTVALGSSGQWATPGTEAWWERMADAMDAICDEQGRPPCKLHGLRMLDPAIFSRLPLASADSTNAVRNSSGTERFGMYWPPTAAQRMDTIASRIEAHQSAAVWVPRAKQRTLAYSESR
jgi:hypothetical protein